MCGDWTEVADSIKQKHGCGGKPEGIRNNKWVVLDYFDVIMHVMLRTSAMSTISRGCGMMPRK